MSTGGSPLDCPTPEDEGLAYQELREAKAQDERIREGQRNAAQRKKRKARATRRARNAAMESCGLVRGKDSAGRTIWE
jgi:hypothetical protein